MLKKRIILGFGACLFLLSSIVLTVVIVNQTSVVQKLRRDFYHNQAYAVNKIIETNMMRYRDSLDEIIDPTSVAEIFVKHPILTLQPDFLKNHKLNNLYFTDYSGNVVVSAIGTLQSNRVLTKEILSVVSNAVYHPLFFFSDAHTLMGIARYNNPYSLDTNNGGYAVAEYASQQLFKDIEYLEYFVRIINKTNSVVVIGESNNVDSGIATEAVLLYDSSIDPNKGFFLDVPNLGKMIYYIGNSFYLPIPVLIILIILFIFAIWLLILFIRTFYKPVNTYQSEYFNQHNSEYKKHYTAEHGKVNQLIHDINEGVVYSQQDAESMLDHAAKYGVLDHEKSLENINSTILSEKISWEINDSEEKPEGMISEDLEEISWEINDSEEKPEETIREDEEEISWEINDSEEKLKETIREDEEEISWEINDSEEKLKETIREDEEEISWETNNSEEKPEETIKEDEEEISWETNDSEEKPEETIREEEEISWETSDSEEKPEETIREDEEETDLAFLGDELLDDSFSPSDIHIPKQQFDQQESSILDAKIPLQTDDESTNHSLLIGEIPVLEENVSFDTDADDVEIDISDPKEEITLDQFSNDSSFTNPLGNFHIPKVREFADHLLPMLDKYQISYKAIVEKKDRVFIFENIPGFEKDFLIEPEDTICQQVLDQKNVLSLSGDILEAHYLDMFFTPNMLQQIGELFIIPIFEDDQLEGISILARDKDLPHLTTEEKQELFLI
ncbi:MAG: hypothetical protein ACRCTQ_05665 [Brevinemataceae bacterium]